MTCQIYLSIVFATAMSSFFIKLIALISYHTCQSHHHIHGILSLNCFEIRVAIKPQIKPTRFVNQTLGIQFMFILATQPKLISKKLSGVKKQKSRFNLFGVLYTKQVVKMTKSRRVYLAYIVICIEE